MSPQILVLDPIQNELEAFATSLASLGYTPFATTETEKACAFLRSKRPSLIFCDILSLSADSSGLLSTFHRIGPPTPIIILTSLATVEMAAAAVREGALFYLLRPLLLDNLKPMMERSLGCPPAACLEQSLEDESKQTFTDIIVGASQAIQRVLELVARIARSNANIIIFGESGTGKELFAK